MTAVAPSIAQGWADLDAADRSAVIDAMSDGEVAAALSDWRVWARPEQLTPPGDWRVWLILAGRGWGKTLTGAEDVKAFGLANPGSRIAILAPTYADARDTCVEGESGLLSRLDPDVVEAWNRSLGELTLTNGTRFKLFSSDEPDRLRGPQHHRAWIDELCAFKYAQSAYDMLMFGLRLGADPRVVITTTPKPAPIVRDLLKRVGRDVHLTRGRTGDNRENLAPAFLDQIVARYSGTRIARQELEGEVLEDVEGALWTLDGIDATRLVSLPDGVRLDRVVVAVDPSGGDGEGNDEQGIVVAARGSDKRGYVLADRSCKLSPDGWGRRAVQSYLDFSADAIVCEANFGGDMVAATIRTAAQALAAEGLPTLSVPTRKVTASRGKRVRAEPVAALYEQGRVSHLGSFPKLEDQMTGWTPGMASPDRLDAMVWALTELVLGDLGSFAPLDF